MTDFLVPAQVRHEKEQDVGGTVRLLLRVEEAAEALAISRTALYVLLRAGEVPAVHIGRSVRIPLGALEAYVERRSAVVGVAGD